MILVFFLYGKIQDGKMQESGFIVIIPLMCTLTI